MLTVRCQNKMYTRQCVFEQHDDGGRRTSSALKHGSSRLAASCSQRGVSSPFSLLTSITTPPPPPSPPCSTTTAPSTSDPPPSTMWAKLNIDCRYSSWPPPYEVALERQRTLYLLISFSFGTQTPSSSCAQWQSCWRSVGEKSQSRRRNQHGWVGS